MKKNRMMRLASFLLVAVLLTSSIISGTFAKYVTEGDAADSARVAKFGVVVTAGGDLFSETYLNANSGNVPGDEEASITVNSSSDENVVAPGTNGGDGVTISITGTPEVDVVISFSLDDDYEDVFLGEGEDLPDMTTSADDATFDLEEDYYPIVYTLRNRSGYTFASGSLDDIKTALDSLAVYVDAGTSLSSNDYTYVLTWAWAFSDTDSTAGEDVDKADTLLGDIAAGTVTDYADGEGGKTELPEGFEYSTEVELSFTVTVTQVD